MKIEGQEVVQVRDPEEPKIINLMEALKRSVAEAQAAGGAQTAWSGDKSKAKAGLQAGPQRQARPHRRRQEEEGWLRPFRVSFPPCWPSPASPSIRRNTSSSSSGTGTAPEP